MKYIIFSIIAVVLIILAGISGYNQGKYDGMDEICNKDLLTDDKGNIFCDDVKKYIKEDIYYGGFEFDYNKT